MKNRVIPCLALLALAPLATAQTTPAPPSANAPAGAVPPSEAPPAPESTVQMSPYEVQEQPDNSYGAVNSNAITRFSAELDKLPLSADVYDQAFMNDVGSESVESMIENYSAGAGFAGADPAAAGATGGAAAQPGDHVSHGYIQLRGFGSPRIERDSLMPVGSFYNPGSTSPNNTSTFDVEEADVIDGPQALLYSGGGAGGVINIVSKQARLGQPAFGSVAYDVDQYGSKRGQLDFGAGSDEFAVRVALLDQTTDTRRVFIDNQTHGAYAQIAFKVFSNTTVRIEGEQTTYEGNIGNVTVFDAGSTTADARESDQLRYLLATNEAGAINPLTGAAYGSGATDNGLLNWGNVDSELGWQSSELDVDTFETITADSKWNDWLSTEVQAGYNTVNYDLVLPQTLDYYSPVDTGDTLGQWAIGDVPGDQYEPGRTKGFRASAVATNDLFGGSVHSETIVGGDFVRSDAAAIEYAYFAADSNGNALVNPATIATNDGRTIMPKQEWSIANGIIQYPLFAPRASLVNLGGVTYARQIQNGVNPSLISPANPLGVTNSATYEISKLFNKGIFAVNYSEWLNGRLTTLAGIRLASAYDQSATATGDGVSRGNSANFDVGATYALNSWLRAYVDGSSAYEPPSAVLLDPMGNVPAIAHADSGEAGLKLANPSNTISGSLSVYHTVSTNEQYEISSTLQNDINPVGLNGVGATGQWVDLNRESTGLQLVLTATPTPNWRLRLSAADADGTIRDNKTYSQLYNDQFNENSAGQVTYADGTVVYVAPTFNSKTPAYTAANAPAGAVPLAVTTLSTPGNLYYASPLQVTGTITTSSDAAKVLDVVDPVHGAILTGKTNLPISAYQLNPALTGVAVPGTITVADAGDATLGYPRYSVNLTSVYTLDRTALKGFRLGGTLTGGWDNGDYYYYPNGVGTNGAVATRTIFEEPTLVQFNLIAGYSRRFSRVTFNTQLNIFNMFNHYDVLILPSEVTGYNTVANLNATFFGQPRAFLWSNTLSF